MVGEALCALDGSRLRQCLVQESTVALEAIELGVSRGLV